MNLTFKRNVPPGKPGIQRTMTVRIAKIRREIRLMGDLTPEQKERLLEAARKCPVSNTLGAVSIQEEVLAED